MELHEQIHDLECALDASEFSKLSKERQLKIIEEFSKERERSAWKVRLSEFATNPIPLKKSQNSLTIKRLGYSEYLSQNLLFKIGINRLIRQLVVR